MSKDFILPDIGEGIVECEVVEWKVKEGDTIMEDQIVVDVSTDKAIVEIPSMYNGRVTKLYYAESDIAKVHEPLFAIEIEGAEEGPSSSAQPGSEQTMEIQAIPAEEVFVKEAMLTNSEKVLTTPAVRKMAREHNLDLGFINGSGKPVSGLYIAVATFEEFLFSTKKFKVFSSNKGKSHATTNQDVFGLFRIADAIAPKGPSPTKVSSSNLYSDCTT